MNPKNKILLICPSYVPPLIGGHKVWTHNLAENSNLKIDLLTGLIKEGYSEVSGPNINLIRKKQIFGTNEEIIDPTNFDLIKSYFFILRWLVGVRFSHKYEVIVVNGFVVLNALVILLCKIMNIKVVGMGVSEEYTLAIHGKNFKSKVQRFLLKLHKFADAYIVVCHFAKRLLIEYGGQENRIIVIPSSINELKLLTEVTKKESNNKILSVGRLVERKGFHMLVEAVHKIKDSIPDIQVDIVGDGPYKKQIEGKIKLLSMEKYVSIHSGLDDDELSKLYANANLFVLAHMMLENGDTEGCPTVFSEASGSGLPVIGGTGAGADTVIIEGVTGFIVDARDTDKLSNTIKKILNDKELAYTLGKAGSEKIKSEHTPTVTGKQFRKLIQDLID